MLKKVHSIVIIRVEAFENTVLPVSGVIVRNFR